MAKIQFIGRILPQFYQVAVEPYEVRWKEDPASGQREAIYKVRVGNSIINVDVEIANFKPEDISELWKQAWDISRASINLLSFGSGIGLTVILDTLINENGIPSTLLIKDDRLKSCCTAFDIEETGRNDFQVVQKMVLGDPALFRTLNDLIEAMTALHISTINCGRIIDSIRRMISPTTNAENGWRNMHTALNVTRPYQEWISKQSTGPRHADPTYVPGAITSEMVIRTWKIMNRFLEYRKRSNVPLTEPEFPILQ